MGGLPIYGFQVIKKKKEDLLLKNQEIKSKKLNHNPFSLVFGLGKTPNVDKGVLYWLYMGFRIGLEECL